MRYLISIFALLVLVNFVQAQSRTYTYDADFDEGTLVGVEHETVHDQLQLSKEHVILPFIWVPNYDGTVSKVHTETGKELGRYRVAPHSNCNPSRTTVDLQGNCWVGNREAGTVVKIGLYEAGQYADRNGNGTIETSQDLNNDGDITGAEILPWGQDECVLYEVVLILGSEGTYIPGTYLGPYDLNYWGVAPRGLAIDANNNLWAGTWSSGRYYYIDGTTGAILQILDVTPWGHSAYGAVIDQNGVLWSARLSSHILRIDPSFSPPNIQKINLSHTYGLGLDYLGHLFVGGSNFLTKIDINNTVTPIIWTKSARTFRGVVCTSDNNIWVAGNDNFNQYKGVSRYDNNGNHVITIDGFDQPSGVAVDAAGKVWVTDINSTNIYRIDPTLNTVDLTKSIVGSVGHYTYSDMTGIISRTITTKIGTWTVIYDCGTDAMPWGTISWSSSEPAGTSVTVKVRSSNDQITWSSWETATNGVSLTATPDGRYLEVEVTLQIFTGDISPILYDLTVQPGVRYVYFDIKPQSWPNPLNTNSNGVLPVAILGTADFDVMTVDPTSVMLEGVSPIRYQIEDVTAPDGNIEDDCNATTAGPDGYDDLTLKFDTQEIVAALGPVNDGDVIVLTITGNLFDGTPIEGRDCVIIKSKGKLEKPVNNDEISNPTPKDYALYQNHPNPFNPETEIRLQIPVATHVVLTIYNTLGKEIRRIVDRQYEAGYHTIIWYGRDNSGNAVTAGMYIYRIQAGEFVSMKKMTLIR